MAHITFVYCSVLFRLRDVFRVIGLRREETRIRNADGFSEMKISNTQ